MPSAVSEYPTPLTTTIHNPRLKLLNGLKDGKYPLMTFMALPSVRIAQIVALTGFDGMSTQHIAIADDSI
jgi:4-hydroxy-2-oxoheptanedioate aldolase